jgi:hypothetical protein
MLAILVIDALHAHYFKANQRAVIGTFLAIRGLG